MKQHIKKYACVYLSVFSLLLLTLTAVFVLRIDTSGKIPTWIIAQLGISFTLAFVIIIGGEEILKKLSWVAYAVTLLVMLASIAQNEFTGGYVILNHIAINTTPVIPLSVLAVAMYATKIDKKQFYKEIVLYILQCIPIVLCVLQKNIKLAIAILMFYSIAWFNARTKHGISTRCGILLFFTTILVCCIIITIVKEMPSSFRSIASLEKNDSYAGIITILSEYGRIPFYLVITIIFCFYIAICKMAYTTKQSTFSEIVCKLNFYYLLMKASYNLVCIFYFNYSFVEMPFFSTDLLSLIVDIALTASIIILYVQEIKNRAAQAMATHQ